MGKDVSVIIPTYNEHDNIARLVERIQQALSGRDYEIIFVDDNSTDGTARVIMSLSASYPIKLLLRTDKRGLASAVVDGAAVVEAPVIGVMDADLQHPPEVLPALLKRIEDGAEIAIASRYVRGGGCRGWRRLRRIISRGAVFLAHLVLPGTRGIHDPVSGYFMFRKRVVNLEKLQPTGFKILLEMLVVGGAGKVTEVPYVFETRRHGESKLTSRQQRQYLEHLAGLVLRSGELWRFIKFCIVGLSGVGVNLGLLWLLKEKAHLYYLLAAAIGIEVSIISNFILNDFFTFRDKHLPGAVIFLKRLLKFNAVSLAGVGINLAVLWLLTDIAGVYYIIAEVFGIIVATLWNYFLNTIWTWR